MCIRDRSGPSHGEKHTVSAENGLSIGNLYDHAATLAEKHYLCLDADLHMMDDHGYFQVVVRFEGNLQLKESDPSFPARLAVVSPPKEVTTRKARMRAYTAAKLAGESKYHCRLLTH